MRARGTKAVVKIARMRVLVLGTMTMLAVVVVGVRMHGPVRVDVGVRVARVSVIVSVAMVVVRMGMYRTVRVHVLVHVIAVPMRVVAAVRMRMAVDRAIGMPMHVREAGVVRLTLDACLAYAAAASRAHDGVLIRSRCP